MAKPQGSLEWKDLFDEFEDLGSGSILTYAQLNEFLPKGGDIRTNKRYVFEKFKKEMLHQRQKALENIINKGYRIVEPKEHVRLTRKEMARAERRARQAVDILLNTDLTKLTERERVVATIAAQRVEPILATIIGTRKSLGADTKFRLPRLPKPGQDDKKGE